MSRQQDRNDEAASSYHHHNGPVRADAEGGVSATVPGPGSRRGPSANDDRPHRRTMALQLLYENLSASERSAVDTLASLQYQDDQ
jgi:hypothetical protein